jgi:hypothetical protein
MCTGENVQCRQCGHMFVNMIDTCVMARVMPGGACQEKNVCGVRKVAACASCGERTEGGVSYSPS